MPRFKKNFIVAGPADANKRIIKLFSRSEKSLGSSHAPPQQSLNEELAPEPETKSQQPLQMSAPENDQTTKDDLSDQLTRVTAERDSVSEDARQLTSHTAVINDRSGSQTEPAPAHPKRRTKRNKSLARSAGDAWKQIWGAPSVPTDRTDDDVDSARADNFETLITDIDHTLFGSGSGSASVSMERKREVISNLREETPTLWDRWFGKVEGVISRSPRAFDLVGSDEKESVEKDDDDSDLSIDHSTAANVLTSMFGIETGHRSRSRSPARPKEQKGGDADIKTDSDPAKAGINRSSSHWSLPRSGSLLQGVDSALKTLKLRKRSTSSRVMEPWAEEFKHLAQNRLKKRELNKIIQRLSAQSKSVEETLVQVNLFKTVFLV